MSYKTDVKINMEFEVECWNCRKRLEIRSEEQNSRGDKITIVVKVAPCDCTDED